MAGQNNNNKFLIQFSYVAKIPMLIIKSMGNDSNIINSVFTIFFIPPPALNDNLNGCSFEQSGEDFYIVGADSVRKKLGSNELTLYGTYSGNQTITLSDNLVDRHFILSPKTISGSVSSGEYENRYKPFSFMPAMSKNGKNLSITGCSFGETLGTALVMYATVSYDIYYC